MVTYVDAANWQWGPSVVCLGYFDGVHVGHQALIHHCSTIARQEALTACAHSYDVPPISLVKPQAQSQELTSFDEKCALLLSYGAQVVAISRFDGQLMHMPGAQFLDDILIGRMQARHLVVGFDHRFGYQGDTDAKQLGRLCQERGLGLSMVQAVKTHTGQTVSSSALRSALKDGQLDLAEEMLGRPLSPRMLALTGS